MSNPEHQCTFFRVRVGRRGQNQAGEANSRAISALGGEFVSFSLSSRAARADFCSIKQLGGQITILYSLLSLLHSSTNRSTSPLMTSPAPSSFHPSLLCLSFPSLPCSQASRTWCSHLPASKSSLLSSRAVPRWVIRRLRPSSSMKRGRGTVVHQGQQGRRRQGEAGRRGMGGDAP